MAVVRMAAADLAAFAHRFMIFRLTITAAARLFTTTMNFVYRCPGTPLRLCCRYATFFVAFFDMLSLPFLFISIFIFISFGHQLVSPFFVLYQIADRTALINKNEASSSMRSVQIADHYLNSKIYALFINICRLSGN
jgi:hypothetical protein